MTTPNRFRFRAWDGERMRDGEEFMVNPADGAVFDNYGLEIRSDGSMILMQSTGLADKNGVEIFEGDILDAPYCSTEAPVTFENARFRWDGGPEWGEICPEVVSVIGNIYQNPELLKP